MWTDVIGQPVQGQEWLEPWGVGGAGLVDNGLPPGNPMARAPHPLALLQSAALPAVAALALHLPGRVLVLQSRPRLAGGLHLVQGPASTAGLHLSLMPAETWPARRAAWLALSQARAPWRPGWCRATPAGSAPRLDALRLDLDERGGVRAVHLQLHGRAVSATLSRDLDAGVLLQEAAGPPNARTEASDAGTEAALGLALAHLHPRSELGWLHPAAPIPVQHMSGRLAAATYEHWPLALRRSVLGDTAARDPGLRRDADLWACAPLRAAYLAAVDGLMQARWAQHPGLAWRLRALVEPLGHKPAGKPLAWPPADAVGPGDAGWGPWVGHHLPTWVSPSTAAREAA